MSQIGAIVIVFTLLCTCAGLGMHVRQRLPAAHHTRETVELMQSTIGLLVTFAALVLGLLTAAVQGGYATAGHDRQEYALQLTVLDQCLRDYGPEGAAARADIRSYTAAVIASTWPGEPPPAGVSYPSTEGMPRVGAAPALAGLMNQVGVELSRLTPADRPHERLADLCMDRYKDVLHARLAVIEDVRGTLLEPLYQILVFWLMVMFACFGLVAPRNTLSIIMIGLCAASLSSVFFVIADLSEPYTGFFHIPSTAMRTALAAMMAPAP